MEIVKAWEEEGVKVGAPFARTIKVLFAPDRHDVNELTFTFALIEPHSMTDYHTHDRPELIYVVSGKGESVCEGNACEIQPDVILWVRAGEKHQIKNTGDEILKLATVFTPAITAEFNYNRCLTAAKKSQQE